MLLRKCASQSALPWNLSASNLTKVWGGGRHQREEVIKLFPKDKLWFLL